MIKILVDEAYAFDYLSILEVKNSELRNEIAAMIAKQVGVMKTMNVYASEEYDRLFETNKTLFDCVERARYGTITAKELDEANMQRHYAKQALQKRFFQNDLTETKT